MAIKYLKPKQMNHPLKLRESDVNRIVAVINEELDYEWISDEEMEAFQDQMFDIIASKSQTHEGSLVLQ